MICCETNEVTVRSKYYLLFHEPGHPEVGATWVEAAHFWNALWRRCELLPVYLRLEDMYSMSQLGPNASAK